jgi:hypothetical protein
MSRSNDYLNIEDLPGEAEGLLGYDVSIYGGSGNYSNTFVYKDELDSYEPPFGYKIIGMDDVFEEPKPSEFSRSSVFESQITETESIILRK